MNNYLDNFIEVVDEYDATVFKDECLKDEILPIVHAEYLEEEKQNKLQIIPQKCDSIDGAESQIFWPESATKLLISLRGLLSVGFEKSKKKGQKALLWKEISDELQANSHNYSPKSCDDKWRRLMTRFRQVRDHSKKSGSSGIKWQYFNLIQNALDPVARQAVSPPKNLLHESSESLKQGSSYEFKVNSSYTTEFSQMPSVQPSTSLQALVAPILDTNLSPNICEPSLQTLSPQKISSPTQPTSNPSQPVSDISYTLTKSQNQTKIPSWFSKFEELKNKQLEQAQENAIQLRDRIDKLEKREEKMLLIQQEIVKRLDDANQIEIEKLNLFKKMFDKT